MIFSVLTKNLACSNRIKYKIKNYDLFGAFNILVPRKPASLKWMEMVKSNHLIYKELVHHPIDSQPLITGRLRFEVVRCHAVLAIFEGSHLSI